MKRKYLNDGNYVFRYEGHGWYDGEIRISLRETEKSFVLTLVSNTLRYYYDHFVDMFKKTGNRVVIPKQRSPHAIVFENELSEEPGDWFVIYPYQAGIPFVFDREEEKRGQT